MKLLGIIKKVVSPPHMHAPTQSSTSDKQGHIMSTIPLLIIHHQGIILYQQNRPGRNPWSTCLSTTVDNSSHFPFTLHEAMHHQDITNAHQAWRHTHVVSLKQLHFSGLLFRGSVTIAWKHKWCSGTHPERTDLKHNTIHTLHNIQ